MSWSSVKIEKLCSKVVSGGTPSTKKDDYYGGNIPWLRTQEVNFVPIDRTELTISELGLKNSSAKWVPANTVIVAMYGATAGRSAITKIPLTTNQACCNLIVNPDVADYRFLYYSLVFHFKELESLAHGSAQTNLSLGVIKVFEISCPILSTQTQIANILSAYDDLIENNRRRIALLEEAARKLYKAWFVKRRFPGWESVPVGGDGLPQEVEFGTFVQFLRGKVITKRDAVEDGGIPVVAAGMAPAYFTDKSNVLWPSVTVSASGANAGYVWLHLDDIWASDCSFISRKETPWVYFIYLYLQTRQEALKGMQKGAAQPHVHATDIAKLRFFRPSEELLKAFTDTVSPFFLQIRVLLNQNRLLAQSRDKLLPKLMSGELSVENIALPTA